MQRQTTCTVSNATEKSFQAQAKGNGTVDAQIINSAIINNSYKGYFNTVQYVHTESEEKCKERIHNLAYGKNTLKTQDSSI